jgi:hypothetical protein
MQICLTLGARGGILSVIAQYLAGRREQFYGSLSSRVSACPVSSDRRLL